MTMNGVPPARPFWQRCPIDMGRRRSILGCPSLVVAAAAGSTARLGQTPRTCVLTPEAGEGPFYLDPKLFRSDITLGCPERHCIWRSRSCAKGTARRSPTHESTSRHADGFGLYSGYAKQTGVGGISPEFAVGKQYLRGTQLTDKSGRVSSRRSSRAGTAAARRTCTSKSFWVETRSWPARFSSLMRSPRRSSPSGSLSRARIEATNVQLQRPHSTGRPVRRRPLGSVLHRTSRARRRTRVGARGPAEPHTTVLTLELAPMRQIGSWLKALGSRRARPKIAVRGQDAPFTLCEMLSTQLRDDSSRQAQSREP